ncbi:MAG: metal-dependent phosphohydrolase HD subdomain protein [Ignavibacteria bacterium]|nr:MAG: metal-dependent phosphohydrolase HD subdomain protein [Ignavibacteria bacterium]KAF0160142.1 MAG: metal-dependent phosphohydrolase HD subdomain protein [Ignavibacteria bacterium]
MTTAITDFTQRRERTELILKKVNTLAPLPKILQEILQLLNDFNTSPHTLAKAISKDQSVVLKILTIANSPFYGLTKRVSSIEFAIMILGYDEIRNIVSALSLMESMKNKSDQYLDQKVFWMHSYLTATIAKKLAMDLGLEKHGEAFIGGLLHDLGISVIHRFMHTDFVAIYELVANGSAYNEAELQILGLNHGEVGESLLKYWNIPELITDIVKYHHQPYMSQQAPTLASVVHLADYMTQMLKVGELKMDTFVELDHHIFSTLHVKDLTELSHFIEGYREPLKAQMESLKYLI